MPLSQGQILHNRYRIASLLGQGGFGAVYKAWDITLNVPCAVKESFELSPDGQRQFLREAQILAGLRHPSLPRVTDYFALPGQGQYLVMDFVAGDDLEALRTQAGGRLPEAQALRWIVQVCEALEYLHNQQPAVIHRDIKPANIKITPDGRVMLVDFGIAKIFDPQLKTTLGARAVTPGYSPIEQYGQGSTDARSDIYSLGATLYNLLTGLEPPEAPKRAAQDTLIPPGQVTPTIQPAVEAAIIKSLHMNPTLRFQMVGEFRSAISQQPPVAGAQMPVVKQPVAPVNVTLPGAAAPVPTPQATFGVPLPKARRRLPWKWLGIGVGVVASMVALVMIMRSLTATPPPLDTIAPTFTGTPTFTAAATAKPATPAHTLTSTPSPLPPMLTPSPLPPTHTATPAFGIGDTQISPVDGMVLVYIPAGTFLMGSEDGENDERPVHSVTLDAFWMDQTEVTNGMYAQCVADRVCTSPINTSSSTHRRYYGNVTYANYPVIYVNSHMAATYCEWAGRHLPTEAQWEYAARGGLIQTTYPWGEGIDCTRANFGGTGGCVGDTSVVGSYPPNGYGLYDMAGNVWEWVADRYGSYTSAAVENPSGSVSGEYYALRGGSWGSNGDYLRVSSRSWDNPSLAVKYRGFRCAFSS